MKGPGPCLSLVWVLAAGCSNETGFDETADAGQEADGGPGFEPAPPEPPERPRMTPCPKGWHEVADRDDPDLVTCDPWPKGGPRDCALDEAHFPGGAGCERIGTACPAGDWAEDLPAGASTLYVKAGAAAGGDGTLASPFARIADAVAVAGDDAVIALSKGTFDESLTIGKPVTIWGACVAETLLAASTSPTLRLSLRGGTRVGNLRVSGAGWGISVVANALPVTLESVVVDTPVAIGVNVDPGAGLVARDLVVRDVRADGAGAGGYGLEVSGGVSVELTRASFERSRTVAFYVAGAGTLLSATDLAVRDTEGEQSSGMAGYGMQVSQGARVELLRTAILGNRTAGVYLLDPSTALQATDVVFRDTLAREANDEGGTGLDVIGGATATLSRAVFQRNHQLGLRAADEGTVLTASDIAVVDTLPQPADGRAGHGLDAFGGASVEITRAVFERNTGVAISFGDDGTRLDATDLLVSRTAPQESDLRGGHGLEASGGADVVLVRAAFQENRYTGLILDGAGTLLEGSDVSVRDTQRDEASGGWGTGLLAQNGAHADLSRIVLERNRLAGVRAMHEDTQLSLTDVVAASTVEQDCGDCMGAAGGSGVVATLGAAIALTSFRASDNVLCGIQLANGGTVDLHGGEVSRNRIGVNVQTGGFDLERVQDGVVYLENEVDLDSSLLPVPEAVSDVEL